MEKLLRKKLSTLAALLAHPYTFFTVEGLTLIWIIFGYVRHFPQKWITATELTLAFGTFLVVFIVQFSEESELEALQQKLDEVIKALPGADNTKKGLEKDIKAE